jgi:hypothetical protein
MQQWDINANLSPGASWTEGIGAAGEEALAVAEENLDVIVAVIDALAFVLTGDGLIFGRRPGRVFYRRQRRQGQAVEVVPTSRNTSAKLHPRSHCPRE